MAGWISAIETDQLDLSLNFENDFVVPAGLKAALGIEYLHRRRRRSGNLPRRLSPAGVLEY